jgi:hypothetical protein
VDHTFISAAFFYGKVYLCINFDKNGLGYILVDSFTISSGHPGEDLKDE